MKIDFTKDDHETLIRLDESMENHLKHHEKAVTTGRFYLGLGLMFALGVLTQIIIKWG